MRRLTVLVLSVLTLVGAVVTGTLATASAHRAFPDTAITVLRPVNLSGHSEGYSIRTDRQLPIDCRFRSPSPGAVSPNIEWCSPTAADPFACWKAAAPHRALCLLDARKTELVRYRRVGRFAQTEAPAPDDSAPLWMRLANGEFCTFRAGGAWPLLPGHPHLYGTYGCGRDDAVWATLSAVHHGVNESQSSWTVLTARFGTHRVITRHIVRAWFVGTAVH